MTYDEACDFLDRPDVKAEFLQHPLSLWVSGLVLGLSIIARHEPESEFGFAHNMATFTFSEETTEAEVLELNRLGFMLADDGWTIHA